MIINNKQRIWPNKGAAARAPELGGDMEAE